MKKTKILMPLTGIAALGAVAPVAVLTSCNGGIELGELVGIEVDTSNAQTEYYYGNKLQTLGLKVWGVYKNNIKRLVELKDCTITPTVDQRLSTVDQIVTIKYKDKEATYPINVWDNMLDYDYREDSKTPEEGEELDIAKAKACEYYFLNQKVTANIADDILYQLSTFAAIAQDALSKTEDATLTATERQEAAKTISDMLKDMGAEQLNFVGAFKYAVGTLNNLSVDFDQTTNTAYLTGDIVLGLQSKIVDRTETEKSGALPTTSGNYVLTVTYHMDKVPYTLIYTDNIRGWMTYLNPTVLDKDTNWWLSREYNGVATYTNGRTEKSVDQVIWDATTRKSGVPSEKQLTILQWKAWYLEQYWGHN